MENQDRTRLTKVEESIDFYRQKWQAEIEELEAKMKECTGSDPVNPNSPRQVSNYVYDVLKLKPKGRGKSAKSVSKDTLPRLALQHEYPRLLAEHRRLNQKYNTYKCFHGTIWSDWFNTLSIEDQEAETERWRHAWQEEYASRISVTD